MSTPLRRLRRLLSTPGPSVALEIAATHVAAAALGWSKTSPRLLGHALVALPDGAVVPSAASANIPDQAVVQTAIRQALGKLPGRSYRVGVTVPDPVAKVSFVPFDTVPARQADLGRMVAWQVRRAAPYRIEDAQLAYSAGAPRPGGGREFVVALIRRDIVEEYEGVCQGAGAHAGVVDLTSFNLVNAALTLSPASSADWLVVHVAPGYSTLALVRGEHLIFFRNRPTHGPDDLADLLHQTAMYYEDRVEGPGLTRAVLVDTTDDRDSPSTTGVVPQMVEERFRTSVERLSAQRVTSTADRGATGLDRLAAPVGLLLREQAAAR